MPTPHISAPEGAFADVVLMPGDPLRARHLAQTFLEGAELVTSVRSMEGYTGTYRGRRVSVMAHGMGIPSVSIYATELIREYGCTTLIRVGSCGALHPDVALRTLVVAMGASTDSKVNRTRFLGHDLAAVADFGLTAAAVAAAESAGVPYRVGNVLSSDFFYSPEGQVLNETSARLGILAVEMEAAGLYGLAAEHGARALTLLTVSDHLVRDEHLSPEDRRTGFDEMLEVALATALSV